MNIREPNGRSADVHPRESPKGDFEIGIIRGGNDEGCD